jgi:hypothetical protein
MSSDTRVINLEDSGRYLFIFNDKYKVYFFYYSPEKKKLYRITTDKYLFIEVVDEVEVPPGFTSYKEIRFFKPYTTSSKDHVFLGIVTFDDHSCKFSIENDSLVYKENVDYAPSVRSLKLSEALRNVDVRAYIQKNNKLFLVGTDLLAKYKDSFYGVLNLETGLFEQQYYLYSDKGDITLDTVSIDTDDFKVYVGGNILTDIKLGTQLPYMEMFFLRK